MLSRHMAIGLTFSALAFSVLACTPAPSGTPVQTVGIANPASVNCAREGARSEIRTHKDGGQYGVCVFKDGRQCEEWALLRDKRCVAPS